MAHTLFPSQSEQLNIGPDDDPDTCTEETNSGDVCGRERPCQYHD